MRHVLIASVPEREQNLRALLGDLHRQTLPPDVIVVYLDGYPEPLELPGVDVRWSSTRRGAGARWDYVDENIILQDAADSHRESLNNNILLPLDDDFRVAPEYVAATVAELSDSVGMVAWTGHPSLRRYHFLEPLDTSLRLIIGGVGASALRMESIRGITRHRLSKELLSSGGDDELLVSILLHERGHSIMRPKGIPPVSSVDVLQNAPTASHLLHAERWQRRRQELAKEYGWT